MEFYFESTDGKTRIHAIKYKPKEEIIAIIQIIHGMNLYIQMYEELAEYLCSKGIMVVGHDQLGHGLTATSEEQRGYFTEKDADKVLLGDIDKVRQIVRRECPNVPYFMLGDCVGSFILREYMCIAGDKISGAILCSAGNQRKSWAIMGMIYTWVLGNIKSFKYRSSVVTSRMFKGFNNMDKIEGVKEILTSDKEFIDKYYKDGIYASRFTVNAFYNLFKIVYNLNDDRYLKNIPKELPIYIISGKNDSIINSSHAIMDLVKQYEKIGIKNVKCNIYEEGRHCVLFDICRGEIYEDIFRWITDKNSL